MDYHPRDITIRRSPIDSVTDLYEIETITGRIDAVYHTDDRRYTIANFDVDSTVRRQGIGKELLRVSQDHARELGARIIFAAIISRESLDAMTSVFGKEHLYIAAVGDYAPEGSDYADTETSAVLHYDMDTTTK